MIPAKSLSFIAKSSGFPVLVLGHACAIAVGRPDALAVITVILGCAATNCEKWLTKGCYLA
jgi:hypothetical protein